MSATQISGLRRADVNTYWVSKWREAIEAFGGLKRIRAGDMYADCEGATWVVIRRARELYLVSFPAVATSMNSLASIRRALRAQRSDITFQDLVIDDPELFDKVQAHIRSKTLSLGGVR